MDGASERIKTPPFSEKQIVLLREYLNEAYLYLNKNRKIGWDQIAAIIIDFIQDLDVATISLYFNEDSPIVGQQDSKRPGNNLAKFANGTHNSLKPANKLIALYLWLSSEYADHGISFDEIDFHSCKFEIPDALSMFLECNLDETSLLTDDKIIGNYISKCGKNELNIEASVGKNTFFTREKYEITPQKSGVRYGWVLILSSEKLLYLYNDMEFNSCEYMASISLNEETLNPLNDVPLKEVLFLDSPEMINITSYFNEIDELPKKWISQNTAKIKKFHRIK